jgi:putative phosphoribosyl transferase
MAMKAMAMARARYRLGWRRWPAARAERRWRRYGQPMAPSRLFADRADAGRRLVAAFPRPDGPVLVLGLARGGVPVAAEVARALEAPLDVLVVRKVGHPAQPEYALGAVSEDGVALPEGLPPAVVASYLDRARRQAEALRGGRAREAIAGRHVVVVDDGLATGRSMAVALATVDVHRAAAVTMAVPVAAGPGFRRLGERWDVHAVEVVEPPDFMAVGQFYDDFAQVGDEEVARLLAAPAA